MKRRILSCLGIFLSPIIIFLVYFKGWSIVECIIIPMLSGMLTTETLDRISSSTAKIAIDTALINFIVNIILMKILCLIKVNTKLSNRDRTKILCIPIEDDGRDYYKTVELLIDLKYKWLFIKRICSCLGGIRLAIYLPTGMNYTIKNKKDFNDGAIDDYSECGVIYVNLERLLEKNEKENEQIYLILKVSILSEDFKNKEISLALTGGSTNILRRIIKFIGRSLFIDGTLDKHKVQVTKMEKGGCL